MNVVIILPTYNEKENIERIIPQLEEAVFPKITNHTMKILIVDDNSPDGTKHAVEGFSKKWKNIFISSGEKKGLGAAYIRGMTYAIEKLDADILFEMDADGQHDATKIPEFLKKIDQGYDMVIGTRYSDGGSIPSNWPPQRKLYSIIANLFVRTTFMTFSVHDWTGGYRALRKEVFLKEKKRLLNYNGYIFQISFLHKAIRDKFKIAEIPFHFTDRTLGDSKIPTLGYIFDVFSYVISERVKELQRFIKFLVVGGTGFLIQVLSQEVSVKVGVSHPIAAGIGAEVAILSNFLMNNFWTFQDTLQMKEKSNMLVRLIKFNITSLAAIFVQVFAVLFGEKIFGITMHIGMTTLPTRIVVLFPTIAFIVIPLNYIIYNKIIWKTHHLQHEKNHTKEK